MHTESRHFRLKIGELFLKIAFDYCVKNSILEVYLTHFVKENDPLVALLEEFEFIVYPHATNKNQAGDLEKVYVKSFVPTEEDKTASAPLRFAKKYYPFFKDGGGVQKFLVPIQPKFHTRLFPDYPREQKTLSGYQLTPYGNAIKKAYLCNASITKITPGDILIFYRSGDDQTISCIGVVENTLRTGNVNEIVRFVGKRTVYNSQEISKLAEKSVLAILFRHHLDVAARMALNQLIEHGILKSAPQSIMEINNSQYAELKKECKI